MALFKFSEIENLPSALPMAGVNLEYNSCLHLDVRSIIDLIEQEKLIAFNTEGRWSLYQLVETIILKYGRSDLSIATWGLSEQPLRMISNLQDKQLIDSFNALLDYRIAERQPKAWQLVQSIASKIGIAKSHAKITVVQNEHIDIVIIGSQNWTRNNKNESGVLIASKAVAEFYSNFIQSKIND